MASSIQNNIKQSIQAAEGSYHKLVLLVGEAGSGKTSVLREAANEICAPIINVNLEISKRLLELTSKQRTLRLPDVLTQIVENSGGNSTVALDNLEILFDKDLKQHPLRLLQGISRNQTLLVSWSGSIKDGKLIYAEAGHPEYRNYDLEDTLVVSMDGTSTIDSAKQTGEAEQV